MRWSKEQYLEYMGQKKPKKSKYSNKKSVVDGITFDSKKEAEYYCSLKLLKRAGIVKEIELQPKFILQEKFKKNGKTHRAITYIADFKVTYADGKVEIVDVKGMETDVFKLKKKMFEYQYPDLSLKVVK